MHRPAYIVQDAPLAPLTTLDLGGPARWYAPISTEERLHECVQWCDSHDLPLALLAGGSNVVIADEGFDGLVLHLELRSRTMARVGDDVYLRAGAGEPWDDLVCDCVDQGFAGLECLSGIPGSVGATPIQNVGAYGAEVSQSITRVRVYAPCDGSVRWLEPGDCEFGYRQSWFKRNPGRAIVLEVEYRLRPGGEPTVLYPELRAALPGGSVTPTIVRQAVLALRRRKSMVLDPSDPNRRSAGSFFTNPVVPPAIADRVYELALERGAIKPGETMPRYCAVDGVKLAAGWLIERAGITKGMVRGRVGVSTAHALALVHHGGGRTAELVGLAVEIRDRVLEAFGVTLVPEPVFLGLEFPSP